MVDEKKDPYANFLNEEMDNTEKLMQNPIAALQEQAAANLERIGFVGVNDIIAAFQDRDIRGKRTTCMELKMDHWDPIEKKMIRSVSKLTTLKAEVSLEKAGGYTTLVLQYDYENQAELNRLWSIFTDYGKESLNVNETSEEIPVISVNVVPMSLGGRFGMVATDPIFWSLQPSDPLETVCNQIRILYQPESVMFLRDDNFQSEEVIAKVKTELAAEKIANEAIIRKKIEDEEFQKLREEEMSQYLENEKIKKHTFHSSKEKKEAESESGSES